MSDEPWAQDDPRTSAVIAIENLELTDRTTNDCTIVAFDHGRAPSNGHSIVEPEEEQ